MEKKYPNTNWSAKIVDRKLIASDIYQITIEVDDQNFHFLDGQYVWLIIPHLQHEDIKGNRRAFSLCSPSSNRNRFDIIFRDTGSGYKKSLIELEVGSSVTISGPFGSLSLPSSPDSEVIFIAGGVGIAPFLSFLRSAALEMDKRKFTLVHSYSNENRAIYKDELQGISEKLSTFSYQTVLGRIDTKLIVYLITHSKNAYWYIIGPDEMVANVAQMLYANGISENNIKFEEFYVSKDWLNIDKYESGLNYIEQSLNAALQGAFNHIILTDLDGRIVFANRGAELTTGYSVDEIIGQTPRLWGGLMDKEFYEKLWYTIKVEKLPFEGEIMNRRKSGEYYYAKARISPVFNDSRELVGFVGAEDDITKLKNSERIILEKSKQLEDYFNTALDIIVVANMDGYFEKINPHFADLLGYSESELYKQKFLSFVHPDDVQITESAVKELAINQNLQSFQNRFRCKDGSYRIIEWNASYQVSKIFASGRDITEREELQSQLLLNVAKDKAILSTMGECLVITDETGIITFVNNTFETVIGQRLKDVLGKDMIEVLPKYDKNGQLTPKPQRTLTKVLEKKSQKALEGDIEDLHYFERADGTRIPVMGVATPIMIKNNLIGAVLVFHDISHEIEVNKMKDEFLNIAAHDLRTPSAAIRGFLSRVLDGDAGEISDKARDLLQNAYNGNKRLIRLVDDFLTISRIERGKIKIEPVVGKLEKAVDSSINETSDLVTLNGLYLKYDKIKLPDVLIDEAKIIEVLINLIGNAIKFTPKGGITISHKVENDYVITLVTDTGMGISPEAQKHLFEKYFKVSSTEIAQSGLGLGLYICKMIMDGHNGKIWVESEEGKGSTFSFSLPVAK